MSRPLPRGLIKGNKFKREKFAFCWQDSARDEVEPAFTRGSCLLRCNIYNIRVFLLYPELSSKFIGTCLQQDF